MRFGILGPLTVTGAGRNVAITAGRDRVVLAMLLLNATRIVGLDELIDALWAVSPPVTARGQLQTCVSRLRRMLAPGVIQTFPDGYAISLGPDDLDADVFTRLITEAQTTVDTERARTLYRRALDLWRGPALTGSESDAVRQGAVVLDERHAVAVEDWADLELGAGRARELSGELGALVERFPLRERLRGQLILSLYRSGRQADALAEYRRARSLLLDELGIEPGRELQDLHRRLLTGEVAEPADAVIRCLPRTVADFTGRRDVVDRVVRSIERDAAYGPVVAVIDGMPGSGKTTLALHVAGLVAARYPHAQLFVDLHGHSDAEPVEPAAALLILLRQLGVPAERIPVEAAERVDLWRSELSARQAMVVFDNAASSAQVADLLPTSAGSLALVTSRRRLAGLDGVHTESLSVLAEGEAVALLGRIAGDRVAAEPDAAAEMVRRCGYLPLAIRLAGARLAHRPQWRVSDLVDRLGESALPALAAEDRTVQAAFALSYGQLGDRAQRMFRLLGVCPGETFDDLGAAALAGLPLDEATDLLDHLVDVHLIDEPEPGVFRLHDLLREYAAALSVRSPADHRAALLALLDFQLHALLRSVPEAKLAPTLLDLGVREPARPDLVAAPADPVARLERERRGLGAYVEAAAGTDHRAYAWQIPRAAWRYLWSRGYIEDIAALQRRAVQVATEAGDRSAVAMSANYLASAYFRTTRYDEARHLLETVVLPVRRELGQTATLAVSIGNLAAVDEAQSRYLESAEHSRQSLAMARSTGDLNQISVSLNGLALAAGVLGRYDEALHHQRLRLMMLIESGDREGLANSLLHLVLLKRQAGLLRPRLAHRTLRAALRLHAAEHNVFGEAEAHNELAVLLRGEGRCREALAEHQLAVDLTRRIGDRRFEAAYLTEFATTVLSTGDRERARRMYTQSLALARAIPHPHEQANAHRGLGDCLAGTDPPAARTHWQRAAELYARMRVPERFEVDARLAEQAAPPRFGGDVKGHLKWGDRWTDDAGARSRSGVDPLLPR